MKTLEIIGFKRANLGKKEVKRLRNEGNVPCVVYGGKEQYHFYAPMILFKDIVYTADAHMVDVNIEGDIYNCILQDIQFHPVNEIILHADFLELQKGKELKMNIPVKLVGTAPGVMKGGKLYMKHRYLTVKALPENLPQYIDVDVSKLQLGKAVKVSDLKSKNYQILLDPIKSIVSVEVPRALRGKAEGAEDDAAVEEDGEAETEVTESES
jgi:large subunit ribosomal protein L25